ncbi:unnamed protein product [Clonostachys byssicola]|uniref:Ribosomal RNA methyltransferase FtsJ domain-containing protein n=1 Tax=Clonostachys byssicola TaxID=160290 RepID=A0A9N9Y860_9HYPO|nr:unnamed protein product [Clonostachys byssicola]
MEPSTSLIASRSIPARDEEFSADLQTTETESAAAAHQVVTEYLLERCNVFKELSEIRRRGWENPKGDEYWEKRRHTADNPSPRTQQIFFEMTKHIGAEMQGSINAFTIQLPGSTNPGILDMGSAPGGFLTAAMKANPRSDVVALSLPPSSGGYEILAPEHPRLSVKLVDVTMMAADLGVLDIPAEHPDALRFHPKQLKDGQKFGLVICGGSAVRNHQVAEYRQGRESCRLIMAQVVLGLERLVPGGTIILLLHKPEAWPTVKILYTFSKFASVRLFKPKSAHGARSSFYMVATKVQNQQEDAMLALARWKKIWHQCTFGTQEQCREAFRQDQPDVDQVLVEFGPDLIRMSKRVWSIQKANLSKAPFV